MWSVVIAFGVAVAAFLGLGSHFYNRARKARRDVAFLSRLGGGNSGHESAILGSKPQRLAKSKALQGMMHDVPFVAELADLLEQSGKTTTVAELMVQIFACSAALFALGMVAKLELGLRLLISLMGGAVPVMLIMRARSKRSTAFELQLPQALELIGLYLRSGRSLPQAFLGATEELLPPASEEFLICAEEYRLGRPLDVALKRLAVKYPNSLGFRLFCIAVSVLGQTGGNLVEVLERIKKTLDAGVTYGLRLKAMTGESRMSAYILGALPGLFMIIAAIANPVYFNAFFDNSLGRKLLMIFGGLWFAGLMWIRSLMNSKVL